MFILEGPASAIVEISSSDEETTITRGECPKSAKRDAPTCDLSVEPVDVEGVRRQCLKSPVDRVVAQIGELVVMFIGKSKRIF